MTEKGKPLVCVDFDGVLNDYEGWRGPNYMYSPRPGAKEFLQELQKEYVVAIFSTRPPYNIREWFELYNMPYDKIVTEKVPAVAYIDDRALRFDGNYHKVLYELKNFKTHWEKKYYDGFTCPDWDEDDGLRFHLAYESKTGWWAVNDSGVTLWKEEVIWELNELNNEKEKLEKENKELKEQYADDCNEANSMTLKIAELSDENAKLKQENKELKQVIKEVLKLLEEEVDLFSDKATEHDINAYIELRELDNKDAYYMAISTKKAIKLLKEVIE